MYRKLGQLIIAMLEPLARYPEELKQIGLTPDDIRTAVRVIEVILIATKPVLIVDGKQLTISDEGLALESE